jgi:hypothetical protein
MKTILYSLLSILALSALAGCAETPAGTTNVADKAVAFAQSPAGQTLANTLITVAVSAGGQYALTGNVDTRLLVAATLDGSAQNLRSLANTPQAESPGAVASAVTIGAGLRAFDNTVAPIAAGSVTKQIQSGAEPDQAIENVATVMNVAAAKTRKKRGREK